MGIEWRLPGTRRREGVQSYCLTGTEFQIYKMKRVMGMNDSDGHTTM